MPCREVHGHLRPLHSVNLMMNLHSSLLMRPIPPRTKGTTSSITRDVRMFLAYALQRRIASASTYQQWGLLTLRHMDSFLGRDVRDNGPLEKRRIQLRENAIHVAVHLI